MSNLFQGVTFPQQHLSWEDDAIVRRAIFGDCILRGCALSYNGFDLSMAAGTMLLCGRQIHLTTAQAWTLEPNSGFARLVVTTVLSRTAGEETGHKISAAIDYAGTTDAFDNPVYQDINSGGVRYQALLCMVALGADGITGIADEIITMEDIV